jgi:hypothetical protein
MWPSRAHILKQLTDQSGLKQKAPINWTDQMQKAFDKMRLLMAANALAVYCNHNKQFDIYTDASDFLYHSKRKAGCLLLLQVYQSHSNMS